MWGLSLLIITIKKINCYHVFLSIFYCLVPCVNDDWKHIVNGRKLPTNVQRRSTKESVGNSKYCQQFQHFHCVDRFVMFTHFLFGFFNQYIQLLLVMCDHSLSVLNRFLSCYIMPFFFTWLNKWVSNYWCCVISDGKNESPKNQTWMSNYGSSFIPNKDALIRSSYVFGGLCFLAILYFVFRTCRLRRRRGTGRRTGTRKYRPLNSGAGSQEMEPLGDGGDDDEDEDTLFETSKPSNVTHQPPPMGI